MGFLAQAPLRSNAHAIAHKKHAYHEFGINRWAAGAAVEWRQRDADAVEIEMPVDAPELMIGGHMIIQAEIIKKTGVQPPERPSSRCSLPTQKE
jgi:hypothetical protein